MLLLLLCAIIGGRDTVVNNQRKEINLVKLDQTQN